jgi:hypothetical protein
LSEAIGSKVTRVYGGFRGVDFRGEEINLARSPDSLNVWKDYKETESIRTRPGMELNISFDEPIYGLFFFKGSMLVHSGGSLYKVTAGKCEEIVPGILMKAPSDGFVYDDVFYFKDGFWYVQYDGTAFKQVEGYVPTTMIAGKPKGGGTPHQDVNMLSDYRINTFLADGASKEFYLDTLNIDKDYKPEVKVDDKVVNNYTVDYENGKIIFNDVVSAPLTDGRDNVSVKFKKHIQKYQDSLAGCTLLQVFDNRVFFSGNPNYPNMFWHCSLDDPSYVSDTDFYREGMDAAQVKGLVAGNNALWVFREPSESNTNVFYHVPAQDDEYGKIYPSVHSSVTTGCVGKAINFNDDIVFFSTRGMEGISGDITTEQVVAHRSSMVDRKMIAEHDYKNMILVEWEGYLLVFIGKNVYLADSRTAFTNEDHIEYDWFYWQLEKKITCAKVHDGVLYLGTEDGVYTLTDMTAHIESYWVTPKDKFKYPNHQKTTNKRGCVAEATGDITVYAKTDKTDFELIGTNENVKDYFVSRIKRKKWKDIQLKFHSHTRFSLETVTLEAWVGGYIKR